MCELITETTSDMIIAIGMAGLQHKTNADISINLFYA